MTDTIDKTRTLKLTHEMRVGLPRFVPVIFGNGEDDDTIGLQAAFDNQVVQMGERIYEPGDNIQIDGMHLIIYRRIAVIKTRMSARPIFFKNTHFEWRGPAPGPRSVQDCFWYS